MILPALLPLVAGCSGPETPLVGPCSFSKRITTDKTYSDLALTMVTDKAWDFDGQAPIKSEPDRRRRLAGLAGLRIEWLPTLPDECLRAHADKWIGVKERGVSSDKIGDDGFSSYDREQAEKDDQRRALAQRLGVRSR